VAYPTINIQSKTVALFLFQSSSDSIFQKSTVVPLYFTISLFFGGIYIIQAFSSYLYAPLFKGIIP